MAAACERLAHCHALANQVKYAAGRRSYDANHKYIID
jgi:hypothetical protein